MIDDIAGAAMEGRERLMGRISDSSWPRPVWGVAVLVLVTALGAAVAEASFLHTADDGCAVEIHCIACRSAAVAPGMPTVLAAPKPALPLAGLIAPRSTLVYPGGAPDAAFSRGPPSA